MFIINFRTLNKSTFDLAKSRVLFYYSVVGLQEDMESSIQLMEKLIPKFMANATSIYKNISKFKTKVISNFIFMH